MEGNYTTDVNSTNEATDEVWILVSTGMIFFMQVGFALVESGTVRRKNASSILVKNLYTVLFGVFIYWLVGFGLSFGYPRIFIGHDRNFFSSSGFEKVPENLYLNWDFFLVYAMTCAIIAQGALAERT